MSQALNEPVTAMIIAAGAAVVFVVIVLLIVRELRRPRRPHPGLPRGEDPKDPEVTLVFHSPDTRTTENVPSLHTQDEEETSVDVSESHVFFGSGLDGSKAEAMDSEPELVVSTAGATDPGRRKKRNEDAYLISAERLLFMVADGMGGYAGGELASHLAVDSLNAAVADPKLDVPTNPKRPALANRLVRSIEIANECIFQSAKRDVRYTGMGTTIIAAMFSPDRRRVNIAYVGDSRCYRLRAGSLSLLTTDHTLAAKGVSGPLSEHLRRALGVKQTVKVDVVIDAPQPGDRYLLCSDGLSKMLSNGEMTALVAQESKLDRIAKELVRAANEHGGRDNITVILIGVDEPKVGRGKRRDHSQGPSHAGKPHEAQA